MLAEPLNAAQTLIRRNIDQTVKQKTASMVKITCQNGHVANTR